MQDWLDPRAVRLSQSFWQIKNQKLVSLYASQGAKIEGRQVGLSPNSHKGLMRMLIYPMCLKAWTLVKTRKEGEGIPCMRSAHESMLYEMLM